MKDWCVERRTTPQTKLAADIAEHLFTRSAAGPALIVASQPSDLLPLFNKQWHTLYHLAQKERVASFEAIHIVALTAELLRLRSCHVSHGLDTSILLVKPTAPLPPATYFMTLYITCSLSARQLATCTAQLSQNGVIVQYV